MSEWTKIEPKKPGWYWVIDESNFSSATPIEVRILHIETIRERRTVVEWWNPRVGNWLIADKVQLWQPVDNVPLKVVCDDA